MVKIKICGITNLADAKCAIKSGADFIGFIFVPGTRRYIPPQKAAEIIKKLPKVKTVGVFADMPLPLVKKIIRQCRLNMAQLHGRESPAYCAKLKVPVIKAFRVKNSGTVKHSSRYKTFALLFDAYKKGAYGGTGKKFNWDLVKNISNRKIFLSGGINLSNVKLAVKKTRPFAVDINSGVEKYPGKKDQNKVKKIIALAKRV